MSLRSDQELSGDFSSKKGKKYTGPETIGDEYADHVDEDMQDFDFEDDDDLDNLNNFYPTFED